MSSGMEIVFRLEHLRNALFPRDVIDFGIAIEVKLEQPFDAFDRCK